MPDQRMLEWNHGDVDHVTIRGPDGLRYSKSIAATEEEKRASCAAALRRELAGVEFNLDHLDDEPPPWVTEVPNPATVERTRTSLANTKVAILAELARLEPEPKEAKRGKAA